ncbi:ABC transporter ATP-binding protein [Parasutterella muris]|uniref:ABC transporter ATP-binding protein n=1 Tax=Parasutterella muris TaxID=2565572 RepID=UPI00203FAE00|nr:ABC transporter ATP-binding protein [Parasutterella muris]
MTKQEPLLEVKNLVVEIPTRREKLIALDKISFEIYPGEVLGVVGESGAGKSMVGNSVIGLLGAPAHVAGGEILLNGRRIDNLKESEKEKIRGASIGAIFQDPLTSLNPLFTIGDQMIETIRVHSNLSEQQAREKAISLLAQTGVPAPERRIDNYPHQFSGGMRQRVVIALALSADPKLIIADEPTTALDVSVQAQIIELLKKLCVGNGTAVMLVTHDMGVIAETADRVAVMYAGTLVEIGPVEEMVRQARHPYTIGLMNAIPRISDQRDTLQQIPGSMPRLSKVPKGCPFHPRCPIADEKCVRERPNLVGETNHLCACWKAGEVKADVPVFPPEPFTIRAPEDMPR